VFYPSKWARDSAILSHGAESRKVHQVAWGANLSASNARLPVKDASVWTLLFIGVLWKTKGGDVAVETTQRLVKMGAQVTLHVVGSQPENSRFDDPNIVYHGFLNKNIASERVKLISLFSRAHLLLFPTKFEALGIVSAEAASFGVPTIAYDTGGVAANIIDGQTGILVEPGAPSTVWADIIFGLMSDPMRYKTMSDRALDRSRETLNWKTWAARVADHLYN